MIPALLYVPSLPPLPPPGRLVPPSQALPFLSVAPSRAEPWRKEKGREGRSERKERKKTERRPEAFVSPPFHQRLQFIRQVTWRANHPYPNNLA